MESINNLLPSLTLVQQDQIKVLPEIYKELNASINVISRKDIDNLMDRHIFHSIILQKIISLKKGTEILDLGTGGGLPGIPLAICLPEVHFHLVDARRKKISVVTEITKRLGLKNVTSKHTRAEDIQNRKFDFIISRAVAPVDKLLGWSRPLLKKKHNHAVPNGLFAWKGGSPEKETSLLPKHEYSEVYPLSDYTDDEYYSEKYILYVQG